MGWDYVECVYEWTQDTALGGSSIDGYEGGCGGPWSDSLRSIAQKVMYEASERRWDLKDLQFMDDQVSLNGIKNRAEIYETHPGIMASMVQVLQEGVEEARHCILCSSICLVCKLIWVWLWFDN